MIFRLALEENSEDVNYLKWVSESKLSKMSKSESPVSSEESGVVNPDLSSPDQNPNERQSTSPDSGYEQSTGNELFSKYIFIQTIS